MKLIDLLESLGIIEPSSHLYIPSRITPCEKCKLYSSDYIVFEYWFIEANMNYKIHFLCRDCYEREKDSFKGNK